MRHNPAENPKSNHKENEIANCQKERKISFLDCLNQDKADKKIEADKKAWIWSKTTYFKAISEA